MPDQPAPPPDRLGRCAAPASSTRTGRACRNLALPGQDRCAFHSEDPATKARVRAGRSQGGKRVQARKPVKLTPEAIARAVADLPALDVKTPDGVLEGLRVVAEAALRGIVSSTTAAAVAGVLREAAKVHDTLETAKARKALEAATEARRPGRRERIAAAAPGESRMSEPRSKLAKDLRAAAEKLATSEDPAARDTAASLPPPFWMDKSHPLYAPSAHCVACNLSAHYKDRDDAWYSGAAHTSCPKCGRPFIPTPAGATDQFGNEPR